MKKTVLLALFIMFATFCYSGNVAYADTYSGYLEGSDDSVEWILNSSDGSLVLKGAESGHINYDASENQNTGVIVKSIKNVNSAYINSVKSVKIEGNIKAVGSSCVYMFSGLPSCEEIDITGLSIEADEYDQENCDTTYMFNDNKNLTKIKGLTKDTFKNAVECGYVFDGLSGITDLGVDEFVMPNVSMLYGMFSGCTSLSKVPTINNKGGKGIWHARGMFADVPVNTVDLSKMVFRGMGCDGLLEGSKIKEFTWSSETELKSNVYSFEGMFRDCTNLKKLDLSELNTTLNDKSISETTMTGMFAGCTNLEEITFGENFTSEYADSSYHLYGTGLQTDVFKLYKIVKKGNRKVHFPIKCTSGWDPLYLDSSGEIHEISDEEPIENPGTYYLIPKNIELHLSKDGETIDELSVSKTMSLVGLIKSDNGEISCDFPYREGYIHSSYEVPKEWSSYFEFYRDSKTGKKLCKVKTIPKYSDVEGMIDKGIVLKGDYISTSEEYKITLDPKCKLIDKDGFDADTETDMTIYSYSVSEDEIVSSYYSSEESVQLPYPSKDSYEDEYTYRGWSINDSEEVYDSIPAFFKGDLVLKPVWEANKFSASISFDFEDVKILYKKDDDSTEERSKLNSAILCYGPFVKYTLPEYEPAEKGYKLEGYYGSDGIYACGTDVILESYSSCKFYAKWAKVEEDSSEGTSESGSTEDRTSEEDKTTENDDEVTEDKTTEDGEVTEDKTTEEGKTTEDNITEEDKIPEDKTSEEGRTTEDKISEDKTSEEDNTTEDSITEEDKTTEDKSSEEGKTPEDKTTEDKSSEEGKTTEDSITEENKTTEDKSSEEGKTPEDKTTEDKTSEEGKTTEDSITEGDKITEDRTSEGKTTEDTASEEDKTIEDRTPEGKTTEDRVTEEKTIEIKITEESKSTEASSTETKDSVGRITESSSVPGITTGTISTESQDGAVAQNTTEAATVSIQVVKQSLDIPEISKVSNVKGKKVKVVIKKIDGVSYQYQISTNKKFKKGIKSKSSKKTSAVFSKLKKNTTYYVRVRAVAKKNGDTVLGKWSKVKKVKVKK